MKINMRTFVHTYRHTLKSFCYFLQPYVNAWSRYVQINTVTGKSEAAKLIKHIRFEIHITPILTNFKCFILLTLTYFS